jgi:hypothetical protein
VSQLAVIEQVFAVVRGNHEDGVSEEAGAGHLVEQASDQAVGVGHLAVVRFVDEAAAPGFRRLVGGVRVVQMYPPEGRAGFAGGIGVGTCRRCLHIAFLVPP